MSDLLTPSLRQYKHNDGSDGFVFAYDARETGKIVSDLLREKERLQQTNDELLAALGKVLRHTKGDSGSAHIHEVARRAINKVKREIEK